MHDGKSGWALADPQNMLRGYSLSPEGGGVLGKGLAYTSSPPVRDSGGVLTIW